MMVCSGYMYVHSTELRFKYKDTQIMIIISDSCDYGTFEGKVHRGFPNYNVV